jgi:aminomethyltransferase
VGLAYLPIQYTEIDQLLEVEVRGKRIQAKVVPTPFYKR